MNQLARYFRLRWLAIALLLSIRPLTIVLGVVWMNHIFAHPSATHQSFAAGSSNELVIGRPLAWLTCQATPPLLDLANSSVENGFPGRDFGPANAGPQLSSLLSGTRFSSNPRSPPMHSNRFVAS